MFSIDVKQGLLDFVDMTISDSMGASEGSMATSVVTRSTPASATAVFQKNPQTRVFKADGSEVEPGSNEMGLVANGRSEEHTSTPVTNATLVCRLLLETKTH